MMVAMESARHPYWEPLYNILGSCDLKAIVLNACHIKVVPGHKTEAVKNLVSLESRSF